MTWINAESAGRRQTFGATSNRQGIALTSFYNSPTPSPRIVSRSIYDRVAIMVVITLTVLIGFAALGTDVVFTLYKKRQMQTVASTAAFSGAISLMTGGDYEREARAVAATAGFVDHVNGVVITVNNPPRSGRNMVSTAVEVIVSQAQTFPLVSLIRSGSWNVSARAVATAGNDAIGGSPSKLVEGDGVDGP